MKGGRLKGGFRVVAVMVPVMALAGCFEHTYTIGAGAPGGEVVFDHWKHHWIGGLISPDQELVLEDVCPSGNATIHQEVTFLNGLVTALTADIYAPTTVKVRCDTGRSADFDLESEDVARIVSDPEFLDWVEAVTPELYDAAAAAQEQLDG